MKVALFTLIFIACVACSSSEEASNSPPGHGGSGAVSGNTSAGATAGGPAGSAAASGGRADNGGSAAGRANAAGSGGSTTGGATNGGATNGGATNGGATNGGTCAHDGDQKTTLVFVNHCTEAVRFEGSDIEGQTLAPGGEACVDIGSDTEALSAKRYWGFIGEDPGAEHHSLAEFTFNTDFNDFDWYNISYVDAFNLPLEIVPRDRSDCETLSCATDFLADCPEVGQYANAGGDVVACVSPDRNDGESPVAQYFESCDDAYAWSGDDQHGDDPSPVRACAGEDWDIVFCPEAAP